jgi:type II secretory pathway component PulF
MTDSEKAQFYRELAKLNESALPLDRSIKLLLGQRPEKSTKQLLEGLQQGLTGGKDLADSFRDQTAQSAVTNLEISLIQAGERSGRLAHAFHHLARYFSSMEGARNQMRQAFLYPLVLLHLAILLPEIPALVMAKEGDHPSYRIIGGLLSLWLGITLTQQLWRFCNRRATTSAKLDAVLDRLPFIGPVRRHWALARFTQVSHSCLLAALNMAETVRLAGRASQSGQLAQGAERAAESVSKGSPLAESLQETQAFPCPFTSAIATAEEVGKVDEEMARWSTAETLEAHSSLQRATEWLPKIGYALIMLIVGYRIIRMYAGIYDDALQLIQQV